MNIAVINAKDILKYLIKIGCLIIIIYISIQFLGILKNSNECEMKKNIQRNVTKIGNQSFTECLDISLSLLSYKKEIVNEENILSTNKILAMEMSFFDEGIIKDKELAMIEEPVLEIGNKQDLESEVEEIPINVETQIVEENNVKPKHTTSYGTVKINNQSNCELTEEMLIPDIEIANKKDILIYHTHTCESYTPSERI